MTRYDNDALTVMDLPERLRGRALVVESGCWEWQGWRNSADYGYLSVDGRDQCAHRVAYEALVGPIPNGLELDHLCVNPPCLNPAHLEPVTHAENQRRIAERQTGCRRAGHDWTDPNNVRSRPNGSRYCAACEREAQRRRHSEKTGKPYQGPMAERTHCPQGHPYDEANTYRHNGRRSCRACMQQRSLARRTTKTQGSN
jgi:hypothetical protein